jgi:hypothetical protein
MRHLDAASHFVTPFYLALLLCMLTHGILIQKQWRTPVGPNQDFSVSLLAGPSVEVRLPNKRLHGGDYHFIPKDHACTSTGCPRSWRAESLIQVPRSHRVLCEQSSV